MREPKPGTPVSVDEYMARIRSDAARATLQKLRAIIRDELPEAVEGISYQVPTYKQQGMICCFAAFANHCSFFPGAIVSQFADELKGYKTSKGTIQFPHDKLPPEPLIRRILQAALASNLARKRK